MANFKDAIMMLDKLGIKDVLLPFILIFTVSFAVLENIKPFGSKKKEGGKDVEDSGKKFNSIIALCLGLAVVIPHVMHSYPPKYDIVNIINEALPNVSIITVAVVSALILFGVFGLKFQPKDSSIIGVGLWLLAIAATIYIFGSAAGWFWRFPRWLDFLNKPDTQALIVIVLVFAAIISYITGPKKEKKGLSGLSKTIKDLHE